MAALKAKTVRLIDFLYLLGPQQYVIITYNRGRNYYSNTSEVAEVEMKEYLGCEVKGVAINSGTIQVFI